MALWWLLRAEVARVGLVGVPCPWATAMAQGHLPAAAMASYSQNPPNAPKVRIAPQQGTFRPQQWLLIGVQGSVCQASNPPKPSKRSKSSHSSAGTRYPNKPNTRHFRTQKPPQGHSNGSRAPSYTRSRLPHAKATTTLQTAPKPSRAPSGRSNGFL